MVHALVHRHKQAMLYRTESSMAYSLPLLVFSIISYSLLPAIISAAIKIHSIRQKEQRGKMVSQTLPLFFFLQRALSLSIHIRRRSSNQKQHRLTGSHDSIPPAPLYNHVLWITPEDSGICSLSQKWAERIV